MVSDQGVAFMGDYREDYGVVAWMPLPKLTKEQKERLAKGP